MLSLEGVSLGESTVAVFSLASTTSGTTIPAASRASLEAAGIVVPEVVEAKAVSYTHLDVYKRQVPECTLLCYIFVTIL